LRGRRAEIPLLGGLSSEVDADRSVLLERIRTALRVRDEALRLAYEMAPPRKGEVRGLWVAPTTRQDWDTSMRRARDAGLNAVFIQVGNGAGAIYPSEALPTVEWARNGTDELAIAVESAKRAGLAVHACRSSFELYGAQKDALDRLAADDRLIPTSRPKGLPFLNPGDPRNIDVELTAILELVRKYDLDGFHFTQAAYAEDGGAIPDYGAVSRREFEKLRGAVENWPEDVISGPRKLQYEDWQRDNINRFIQRAAAEVKKAKPHVQISASIAPERGRARASRRQDWAAWARDGWVDFLISRNHSSALDTVAVAVEEQVCAVRGRVALVAGLAVDRGQQPISLLAQVEASREQGADGFLVTDLGVDTLEEQLAALRAGATAEGTWPGYLAPKAEWAMDPIVERPDSPWAMMLGDRANLEVKLLNVPPSRLALKNATAEARLEDPDGRLLQTLGSLTGFGLRKFRFQSPAGRFRPVLRGNMVLADGTSRPFVIRGPLCDGVSPDELAALRAQDAPPTVTGPGRKVAVYAGSRGADQLVATFADGLNVNAFPLYRLLPDHLARAEVLVLGSMSDVADLSAAAVQTLRQWVSNGGLLLLLHEAVGASWHPRMFPEVAVGAEHGNAEALEAAPAIGAIKPGTIIPVGPSEVIWLKPAAGAEVLLREAGERGAPVAVTASVGKGRVVMYGAGLGVAGRRILGPEQEFLWGLLGPR
ncbi:MAG: glycoside hydrolase family 10 protein, partial [Actinomycetota bacterium]